MPTLARYADNGCPESFPNGTEGQILTMVGGQPAWSSATYVSTDAGNVATTGTDGRVYISCEAIQDCIGAAIANGTGLTYDDALNAISAVANIPITSGSGIPNALTNTPVIHTDTDTGNIYYRDYTGAVVELSSHFNVTAGPDATTVITGPIDVGPGDTVHFHGNTIDFTVTAGSARVEGEVAISTDVRNNITTGADGKLYASAETVVFGTEAGNAPAAPVAPANAPAAPITGDQYVESYSDKLLVWEYDGATWQLRATIKLITEATSYGTEAGNAPSSPVAPVNPPTGPNTSDQYVEAYTDKVLFWEWTGAAWVLRSTAIRFYESSTFGTVAGNAPAAPVSPTTAPAGPSTGDQYTETYTDKILVWEYNGATWQLRTTISKGEVTSFGTVASVAPMAPVAPNTAPTSPLSGDQYVETYTDKVLLWEYNGATWVLRTAIRYVGEVVSYGTVTGNAPTAPGSPSSPPTNPTTGDQHIESYDDKALHWEYTGATWALRTAVLRLAEKTSFGTVASAAPAAPVSPTVAPTSPQTGDQYVETYTDKILFWEYSGAAWSLRTTIGKGEATTFGTEATTAPVAPASPATAPASPASGDQYVETYTDKILVWEYDGATWQLRTSIGTAASNIYTADGTLLANRTVSMDSKTLTFRNTAGVDTGLALINPNGTGHLRIDPSGDLELGTSTAGSKIQFQTITGTIAQVLASGIFLIDGNGAANQSGLRFSNLTSASTVTPVSRALAVDTLGNVVLGQTALEQICDTTPTAFDPLEPMRFVQEGATDCNVVEVQPPNCATATPASIALGYNGTSFGFFAMREKLPVRMVVADTALNTLTDGVLIVDASGGDITLTLNQPNDCHSNIFAVRRIDTSSNTVTISSAATINGAASIDLCKPLTSTSMINGSTWVVWTGSAWYTL